MLVYRQKEDFYLDDDFGEIPKGWSLKKFIKCFEFFPTASYSREQLSESGDCCYIHYGDIHTKFDGFIDFKKENLPFVEKKMASRFSKLKEGDLIIADASEDYDGVGKAVEVINIGNVDAIAGLHTLHLRAIDNCLVNGFKAYVLKNGSVRNKILRSATGIKVYSISKSSLKNILIPVPPPTEQRIIASILSKVDETIAATKNSIAKAERLKKALMQNLLTGKLKPNGTWRKKDEFYKDEKFGNVPKGWKYDRLETVLSNCQYGINATSVEDGKFPMLRMNNIIGGKMVNQPMVYIDLDKKLFEKYKVNSGDILFNRTNSMDLVGKLGIFKLEGNYVFASYLIRLTVNQNNIPEYFNYYLNSYEGQCKLRSKATPSVSQANINAGNVKRLIVPIPPKDEQLLISNRIEAIETVLTSKQIKIKKLEQLKKALMQNLLTGKVRVKVPKEQLLTEIW